MADERRHRDHGPAGCAPERGSRRTLERMVRACATASRNECEFVRALREHKVRVRPRYAEGGRGSVVGYSIALPGADSGPQGTIWFGGGRLARDLTLPSLRAGWQQSDDERQEAVTEWGQWTSSRPRTREDRQAELEQRAVHWHLCISDVDRLRAQLRGVDGHPVGSARVARDAAGILAAWSVALEVNAPGSLARASRQLARSAELRAWHRHPPPRRRARGSRLALYLLAGARPDSTAGWFVLARQLSLLGRDLAQLHRLHGEVDRAHELEIGLTAQLSELRYHLESQSPRPPVDPEAAAAIDTMRRPLPPLQPSTAGAYRDAATARRILDATRQQRPRGR